MKNKILIIEDEAIFALCLKFDLEKFGYDICGSVSNGNEALNIVKRNLPDIIIIDVNIPGTLNGIETARMINQNYNIPIIFISGYDKELYEDDVEMIQPSEYLVKPIETKNIIEAIKKLLNN